MCKLKKSMHGLNLANRNWYQKLTSSLLVFGYSQSHANYTLFYKTTSSSYTCLLIYVDDLIITRNEEEIQILKSHLHTHFHIKGLGKYNYFLGIEISQSTKGIFLSQRKYSLAILLEFSQLGSSPSSIPMKHHPSTSTYNLLLNDHSKFRKLVGKLLYLTITRPDISYYVGYLSQFLAHPTIAHFNSG